MSHDPQPWRRFDAVLHRTRRLSPSFVRLTFRGPDLAHFAATGLDTRCKLVLPADEGGYAHLPGGADWLADLRRVPPARRSPVRTYTVRAVRRDAREVDVDAVLHDHAPGPAGRWIAGATVGAPIVLVGPNAQHPGPHGGSTWAPPPDTDRVLLAGDETAVPAISSILEALPPGTRGTALLEVPLRGDRWQLAPPAAMQVRWLPRDGVAHGGRLAPAVDAALDELLGDQPAPREREPPGEPDPDAGPLWEVPTPSADPVGAPVHAWLAAEAGVVAGLRRHLVGTRGLDRRAVAFMGYWRLGRAEG